MASATRDLAVTKSAYTKSSAKNTVYKTNSSTNYHVGRDSSFVYNTMYYGFGAWPASLKRNRITDAAIRLYVHAGWMLLSLYACDGDFTASKVTYNNAPEQTAYLGSVDNTDLDMSMGAWANKLIKADINASLARTLIRSKGFYVYGSNYNTEYPAWYVKTVLSDGSAPFVRVYYDDAVKVTSKVVIGTKLSNTVNPEIANKVTWTLEKNGSYRCFDEVWVQASAKLYWKASDESSWHTINISGQTMSVTIPAFTFPTGKTIQYYIQATDTDGTTTQTATYTCTTPASKITPQNSPTSGFVNPRNPVIFSWYFKHTNGNYQQQSASLFWRVAGAEAWNEVAASGTQQSLTVPAYPAEGSFPIASTIEWYLYGVDSSGSSSVSATYSFSTAAAIITAVCKSPLNNVADGSAPIEFSWEFWSNDGYPAIRTEVYWKQGSDADETGNWNLLLDEATTVTDMTVAGGVFPAGEIDWKVIATNIDGIKGGAATVGTASFICVAAPDPVQGLAATNVPLSTIRWQSSGQEAYEITIDGEVVKKAFGPGVYSWSVPEPLEDGEHIIQVRIQGIYGLWSQPSETSIFITNEPESSLEIEGVFGLDATLKAESEDPDNPPVLHWYRDDKYIGVTSGTLEYIDRFVLGHHEYRAEIWHDSGYYTRSNTVAGTMTAEETNISLLSGGDWLTINLSENISDEQTFNWSKSAAWLHVTGSDKPVLEMAPYEDEYGSYNCSIKDLQEAKRFEKLKGRVVIIKSRKDQILIGGLTSLQKRVLKHYVAFSFTVQSIGWEDFVNHDKTD